MKKEDIIKSEALEFYEYGDWKGKHTFPTAQDLIGGLKLELGKHQVDGQIIYLKEVIQLIEIDAQKHLETCEKKENPNECPTHQFYAKSRYYAEQILDSIDDENDSVETKYEFNTNLSKETLSVLEDLFNGERYSLTKDSPKEISEVIERLNNLGFLNNDARPSCAMNYGNRKYLAKLLELKSWDKFKEWLSREEDSREISVTNIFNESSVGQLNQVIGGGSVKKPVNSDKLSKDSLLKKASLWIVIIGGVFSIGFILYQIFYK